MRQPLPSHRKWKIILNIQQSNIQF
jgi:hypothetical protein